MPEATYPHNLQLPGDGLQGNKYLPPCSDPKHAPLGPAKEVSSQHERQGGSLGHLSAGEGSLL